MLAIKTILHATDFSRCSDYALQVAGSLAKDHQARLVVLHVGRPPLRTLGGPVPPLPVEWGREELEQKLYKQTVTGLKPEYRLEFAEPAGEAILSVAEELPCDLIVLGTHGRTGVGRLLMGSVAEHVVRRATCPVLTVRHLPPAAEASGS